MSFQADAEKGLRFCVLASGSSGNCTYIATPNVRLLVDAGLSGREIDRRLSLIGARLAEIDAVLITHEHSDHVCGLSAIAKKSQAEIFTNSFTAETLGTKMEGFTRWKFFETGHSFNIGDVLVNSFHIPHDACDPTGYTISWGNHRIGFFTDLGYATQLVIEQARTCTALLLEANHDLKMLQADKKRPWPVKQRILSRHGHLSNEAAADLVAEIATASLSDIYLGHLSSDCNDPGLALTVIKEALVKANALHVSLHETYAEKPTPVAFFR